jgi:ABC-type polysaccharide/polyol phosphate export permease
MSARTLALPLVDATPPRLPAKLAWELRVAASLARRELALQYRGTALGLVWDVASPLATTAVYVGLFSGILRLAGPAYGLAVLSALVPWSGFAAALCAGAHAPLTHAALLRGHAIPVRVLVAAAVAAALPGLAAGLTLALASALATGSAPNVPAILALLALQTALAAALALPLALANLKLRDTQHALGYALRLAFFLTPVVWTADRLPAHLTWVTLANPFAAIATGYREAMLAGRAPELAQLAPALVVTLCALAAGLALERHLGRRAAELL